VPGGHGTEFGVPVPTLTKPEEADAWVAARIAEGSDYIKLVEEPGTAIHHPLPTLDAATFKALVAAAHRRGKLAVAHVEDRASAEMAVNAGIDGLMHLFIDQDGGAEFARLAAAHHIFVTPTYVVFEGFSTRSGGTELLTHSNFGQWLDPQAQNAISRPAGRYPAERLDGLMKGNIQALRAAHVPILAGTDAGNPGTWYGASLHRELELLVKAGLTPSESLTAATAAPAKAFHLTDRGRIAPGLKADLLLVEGDPTVDILATRHIVEIWKDGVSANALREERRLALAHPDKAPEAAALALPADGVIGHAVEQGGKADFSAPFGQWGLTTDAIAGGKSTAAAALGAVTPEGAPSLAVSGELRPDFAFPWAGVIFYPGPQPFTPANLANAARVSFRARGTPGEYMVMGFSTPSGPRPVMRPFTVGADWREVSVAFSDLAGFDARQTLGLAIAATGAARAFKLEISEVKLVK
jgi:Amidohydrolase family